MVVGSNSTPTTTNGTPTYYYCYYHYYHYYHYYYHYLPPLLLPPQAINGARLIGSGLGPFEPRGVGLVLELV